MIRTLLEANNPHDKNFTIDVIEIDGVLHAKWSFEPDTEYHPAIVKESNYHHLAGGEKCKYIAFGGWVFWLKGELAPEAETEGGGKKMKIKVDPNSRLERENILSLASSIFDDGFDENKPILVDQNGWILDGNHRYIALRVLGSRKSGVYFQVDWQDFLKIDQEMQEKYQTHDTNRVPDEIYYAAMMQAGKQIYPFKLEPNK